MRKGLIEIQHFQRTAGIDKSPQHQFIKDGRFFSNPKVGWQEFCSILVIFSLPARYPYNVQVKLNAVAHTNNHLGILDLGLRTFPCI